MLKFQLRQDWKIKKNTILADQLGVRQIGDITNSISIWICGWDWQYLWFKSCQTRTSFGYRDIILYYTQYSTFKPISWSPKNCVLVLQKRVDINLLASSENAKYKRRQTHLWAMRVLTERVWEWTWNIYWKEMHIFKTEVDVKPTSSASLEKCLW